MHRTGALTEGSSELPRGNHVRIQPEELPVEDMDINLLAPCLWTVSSVSAVYEARALSKVMGFPGFLDKEMKQAAAWCTQ